MIAASRKISFIWTGPNFSIIVLARVMDRSTVRSSAEAIGSKLRPGGDGVARVAGRSTMRSSTEGIGSKLSGGGGASTERKYLGLKLSPGSPGRDGSARSRFASDMAKVMGWF